MKRERGYPADRARSYRKIEKEAAEVRRVINPDPLALPGVGLFEALEDYSVEAGTHTISLSYAVQPLPPNIEATTQYENANNQIVITLSPETYHALEEEDPRARFTLSHEIGHATMHTAELVRLSTIPHAIAVLARGNGKHPVYRDTEWQSDAFAGAFLMPADRLDELFRVGRLTERELHRRFNVSAQAAQTRISIFLRFLN